ncbi:MAG: LacI family DNA-binding transcriptional regulator, partial [Solirubrobacterales bacterium]
MRVRLRDLAEGLGLSVMAVSKALHDAPDIGAATKARVRAEAEKRGYWPNQAARSLRSKQSGLIGLLVPDLASEESAGIAGGLLQAAETAGISVMVAAPGEKKGGEAAQVKAMMGRGSEAIFILPKITTEHRSLALEAVHQAGLPVIFFQRYPADVSPGRARVSWVVRDMGQAAQLVLDRVWKEGHRAVAYLGGHSAERSHAEHLRAVRDGAAQRGMELVEDPTMAGLTPEDGEREMERILKGKTQPTAVICGNDAVASGAARAALKAGLKIPGDLSLAGLGDGELAQH